MPKKQFLKCYFGCDTEGPFHRFPYPEYPNLDRFNLWKAVLAPAVQDKGDLYIYNNVRFCDSHFEERYRLPSKRLTRTGIPTLNIPSTSQNIFPVMEYQAPNTVEFTFTQPQHTEDNASKCSGKLKS
ncbi:hypothetical protein EVAR_49075_1 [Eumeta japonica]|uniref:THAP-type domain-containing protein n=1 Tax=Eumeta variegata TaxID=151549 RepID=A0A4C2ABS3_EUMVA|nr:hypothetical protein EVAR_6496_1 [Eumeta japonica]GBP97272.1 hypothetical protein EVAR_49075_1 [Eumeta japonica]